LLCRHIRLKLRVRVEGHHCDGARSDQTRKAEAKFLANPILEHGATLLRQRHAVKDYFPSYKRISPNQLVKG
jgi:hypothetical protein